MDVEIWSDIACPWCYVGKRRFETALAEFEHRDDVRVTWRSFELDRFAPPEAEGDRATRLAAKYGITVEQAHEMERQLTDTAAGEGLDFRFDIQRSGRTYDAHRLVHLAGEHGLQEPMKERLMRAYFTEGQLMSDPDTLIRLAGEVGVDGDEVRDLLAGGRFGPQVRRDERMARELGISAVPTFVLDRSIGASGAHPPDALLDLLREGWERHEQAIADGEANGAGGEANGGEANDAAGD